MSAYLFLFLILIALYVQIEVLSSDLLIHGKHIISNSLKMTSNLHPTLVPTL